MHQQVRPSHMSWSDAGPRSGVQLPTTRSMWVRLATWRATMLERIQPTHAALQAWCVLAPGWYLIHPCSSLRDTKATQLCATTKAECKRRGMHRWEQGEATGGSRGRPHAVRRLSGVCQTTDVPKPDPPRQAPTQGCKQGLRRVHGTFGGPWHVACMCHGWVTLQSKWHMHQQNQKNSTQSSTHCF